ncbi:acyloxyacyl hydrolase [Larkinella terrae]|uniref:Acyloxyacyl hydrolase n=1 Tax=Larkinella terrae TaxID=2025311 RepID=A0A7K0EK75_9BACT|nr:acyloxyacyl hydrolase [Larkinella terrae]MRS61858.1 acyloxyacyl hydrolase [Larkinella terrae]
MVRIFTVLFLFLALHEQVLGQAVSDSLKPQHQLGFAWQQGIAKSNEVVPVSQHSPLGVELSYSQLSLGRRAWENCQCFARVGGYVNYFTFRNPVPLGRTMGAGLFFEPLIHYSGKLYFSVRALAGLTYLTRVYDPIKNPSNNHFSMPVSALIGASFTAHYRLNSQWNLAVGAVYNHISNAGTRLPNQGMNIPTVTLGAQYALQPVVFPDIRQWQPARLTHRWIKRALLMGSVRVLPKTDKKPEMALPVFGINLVGGYRVTRSHAFTAGFELVDDRYFKEQVKTWGLKREVDTRQATILAGYEFWQGRFIFAAHHGWNIIRPLKYKPATYQRYNLLYRFRSGITMGMSVKAYGENTKGFSLMAGYTL